MRIIGPVIKGIKLTLRCYPLVEVLDDLVVDLFVSLCNKCVCVLLPWSLSLSLSRLVSLGMHCSVP